MPTEPTEASIRAALSAAGIDPDAIEYADPPPRNPAPDPSQGRGAGGTGPADYRTASTEDYHAELRRLGARPPRH